MRIESVTLREIHLRLKGPFETSFGSISERRILLVEVESRGATGWGEATAGEGPFYNSETTDTSWIVLTRFIVPLVLGRDIENPEEIPELLASIRGHEMSKAALENAVWDMVAKEKGISLAKLLGGTREEIPCGVSLGIRENPRELLSAISMELTSGYQRIKIKIKPGKDLNFIASVRNEFPHIKLMVDANSAYRLEDAPHLKKFDDFGLTMIEQPLAWDDIWEHAKLQAMLNTPICLDESIHNLHQTRAAIEMCACRILNIKLGRVGGHRTARRIEEYCRAQAVPIWCGGFIKSTSRPNLPLRSSGWSKRMVTPKSQNDRCRTAGLSLAISRRSCPNSLMSRRTRLLTSTKAFFQSEVLRSGTRTHPKEGGSG